MTPSNLPADLEPTSEARDLVDIFCDVPDMRVLNRCDHRLGDILFIALCSTLCGSGEFTDMEDWGILHERWLVKFLQLEHGIPSHDTFRRVLSNLEPKFFLEAFECWVNAVRQKSGKCVVSIDGKACRGTKGLPGELLTIVGAWASDQGISLGQLQVEGKSNEITAVPELLEMLDIEGSVVTTDAMGCQKEIAAKCLEKKAGYALALKGNQGGLHLQVSTYLDGMIEEGLKAGYVCQEKARGRTETRRCWALGDDLEDWLEGKQEWEGLRSVVAVELEREEGGETTVERRYFITSLEPDAEELARVVRAHWGVENSLHWVLDVVFGEDASRARTRNAGANLSMLRRLSLNLLKVTPTEKYKKWTMKRRRSAANADPDYLASLAGLSFGA